MPSINVKLPSDKVTDASKAEASSELALNLCLEQTTSQLEKIKAQMTDAYSNISAVKNDEHGLKITYQLNKTYTIQADTPQQIRDSLKSLNSSILSSLDKSGVIDATLRFVVLNGDGSVVIDEMFTQ
ncbi:hypothetical protein OfM2_13620 [Lactovum odontotermitis]